jgi:septation ring formation regulator EzrA
VNRNLHALHHDVEEIPVLFLGHKHLIPQSLQDFEPARLEIFEDLLDKYVLHVTKA